MMASAMAFLAKIDSAHLFVVHDFGGCTLGKDRTLHQHGDLFSKAENDVHIVLDDENGDVGIERRNDIENEMAFRRRYTRRRFVEEQHAWLLRERNRYFHQPMTPMRQFKNEFECVDSQPKGI